MKKKRKANLNILFNGKSEAIKFYDDYSWMILEAKKRAPEEQTVGTGLKTLTLKQML